MLSEEEVLEQFRGKARLADGDIYLAQDDVSALVNVCQENDLAVLGLEGGTYAVPMMVRISSLIST